MPAAPPYAGTNLATDDHLYEDYEDALRGLERVQSRLAAVDTERSTLERGLAALGAVRAEISDVASECSDLQQSVASGSNRIVGDKAARWLARQEREKLDAQKADVQSPLSSNKVVDQASRWFARHKYREPAVQDDLETTRDSRLDTPQRRTPQYMPAMIIGEHGDVQTGDSQQPEESESPQYATSPLAEGSGSRRLDNPSPSSDSASVERAFSDSALGDPGVAFMDAQLLEVQEMLSDQRSQERDPSDSAERVETTKEENVPAGTIFTLSDGGAFSKLKKMQDRLAEANSSTASLLDSARLDQLMTRRHFADIRDLAAGRREDLLMKSLQDRSGSESSLCFSTMDD